MFLKYILPCVFIAGIFAKNWSYTFDTFDIRSNVDYLRHDLKLVRISRGDYALNGTFTLDKDIGQNYKVFVFSTIGKQLIITHFQVFITYLSKPSRQ